MNHRTATLHRKTRETDIAITLDLDGTGACSIETGIPFINHLLELVALDTERTAEAIEHVGNSEVYRLRGDLWLLQGF